MISTTASRDEGPSVVAWGDCFYLPAPNPARLDKTSGHSVNMGLRLKDTHLMKKQIKALKRGAWLGQSWAKPQVWSFLQGWFSAHSGLLIVRCP